jgi:hypothetical protein
MRKAFPLFAALIVAGCSGGGDRSASEQTSNFNEAASTDSAFETSAGAPTPPGITPTAAPGVAFSYSYAFRLPPLRISGVQEAHAAACEKLGPDQCRITSLRYESDGDEHVQAQLAFKLNPGLARRFGKEGIDAVTAAEGLLVRAEITGEDVGSQIQEGARQQGDLSDELRRIEQQLAKPGLSGRERAELQTQAQALREQMRATQGAQTARRAQLATTPMVFNYEAGDTDRSFGAALSRAFEYLLESARALLILLVYLLPWALAALLGWLGIRWVNRRFLGAGPASPAPPATPEG